MKTTNEWWNEVSQDENKMIEWLKNQYHGEVTAESRIRDMITKYDLTSPFNIAIIEKIADDEKRHAEWVKELLIARGITAEILEKEERYWSKTLPQAEAENTFTYMCAVAHHAETMRLDRINLLAADERFQDIAEVFKRILPDEIFHAKMFGNLSTPEDIEKAKAFHEDGCNAIGLVA